MNSDSSIEKKISQSLAFRFQLVFPSIAYLFNQECGIIADLVIQVPLQRY